MPRLRKLSCIMCRKLNNALPKLYWARSVEFACIQCIVRTLEVASPVTSCLFSFKSRCQQLHEAAGPITKAAKGPVHMLIGHISQVVNHHRKIVAVNLPDGILHRLKWCLF